MSRESHAWLFQSFLKCSRDVTRRSGKIQRLLDFCAPHIVLVALGDGEKINSFFFSNIKLCDGFFAAGKGLFGNFAVFAVNEDDHFDIMLVCRFERHFNAHCQIIALTFDLHRELVIDLVVAPFTGVGRREIDLSIFAACHRHIRCPALRAATADRGKYREQR